MDKKMDELYKMISEVKEALKNKTSVEVDEIVNKVKDEFEAKLAELARKSEPASDVAPFTPEMLKMKTSDPFVERCQEIWDKAVMAAQLTNKPVTETTYWKVAEKQFPAETKALAAGAAGAGAELVPVGYSRRLWEELMLKLAVAGLHEVVNMPTSPYKFPVAMVDAQAFLVPESTSADQAAADKIPDSQFSTAEFTLDAKKIATRIPLSEELREDSLIDVLGLIQRQVIDAVKRAIENAIINGDDSGTHMDGDVTSATDPRKAFKGYRKIGEGNKVDFGGALDGDKFIALKSAMDKYGVDPDNMAWVVAPAIYFKMLALKDSSGNPLVITRDKYGAQATVITGELGRLFGSPIVVSQFVRTDLNNTGVYDGTTTDKSVVIAVHAPSFVIGNRRDLQVRVTRYVEWDQQSVSAFTRIAFGTPWVGKPVVALGVNVK